MKVNMKLSKRDIGLLTGLLGILLAFACYKFVFQNFQDKTDALKNEIIILSQKEQEMVQLEKDMPFYKEEITRLGVVNKDLLQQFPADILPENEIMYAVELEDKNKIFFSELSYGTAVLMELSGSQTADAAAADQTTEDPLAEAQTGESAGTAQTGEATAAQPGGMQANLLTMTMGYECTYDGLKSTILYNNERTNRMVIDGLTAAYDPTTGQLAGTMTLNQYYITGTENTYSEPYVPSMRTGTDNIFGTYEGE